MFSLTYCPFKMAFGCVRAIINRDSAFIFDAHKPTIKKQAIRISKQMMRKDSFAFRDGEILRFRPGGKGKFSQFELDMVEQVLREFICIYLGQYLYERITQYYL
jgi:hypothetical protein